MTPNPNLTDRPNVDILDVPESPTKSPYFQEHQDQTQTSEENWTVSIFSKLLFWGENEKLDQTLRKWDAKMPTVGSFLATVAMFLLGISARGEWALFAVYFLKYLQSGGSENYVEESNEMIESVYDWINIRFKGYFTMLIPITIISYATYFGLGGFLHWYYYVRQRDHPETWKCQPTKWLSPAVERHEIMVGATSLILGSIISACFATYVLNGGDYAQVYFDYKEYGWIWFFLQVPVVFIYQDYLTYWVHRTYHTPWLYKHFHKLHHTYKQPTAFSVTAIHPIEFIHMQLLLLSAAFIFPVYWANFSLVMMYNYYHGIIDHSGINFKRYWWQPWQPDCIFHDNHHQYFHVNFGFNIELWDHIHGTYRLKDRIYREDIFYGVGKPILEATFDEIEKDTEERDAENPLAHRDEHRLNNLGTLNNTNPDSSKTK